MDDQVFLSVDWVDVIESATFKYLLNPQSIFIVPLSNFAVKFIQLLDYSEYLILLLMLFLLELFEIANTGKVKVFPSVLDVGKLCLLQDLEVQWQLNRCFALLISQIVRLLVSLIDNLVAILINHQLFLTWKHLSFKHTFSSLTQDGFFIWQNVRNLTKGTHLWREENIIIIFNLLTGIDLLVIVLQ